MSNETIPAYMPDDTAGIASQPMPYTLSKKQGHDTWPHREALKALGFVWDDTAKTWGTTDQAVFEQGLYIVGGMAPAGRGGQAGANSPREGQGETGAGNGNGRAPDDEQASVDGENPDGLDDLKSYKELVAGARLAAAQMRENGSSESFLDYARMNKNPGYTHIASNNDAIRQRIRDVVPDEGQRQAIAQGAKATVAGQGAQAPVGPSGVPATQELGAQEARLAAQRAAIEAAMHEQGQQKAQDAAKAPEQPKGQTDKQKALQDALAALAAASQPEAPGLDEDRVREIAREEDKAVVESVAQTLEAVGKGFGALQEQVTELAAREQAAPQVRQVQVTIGTLPTVDATGMHPKAPMVAVLIAAGVHVMLVGKPGTGKTHLSRDVATLLGRRYGGAISLTAGVTESAISGRVLPIGEGRYLSTPFVDTYEQGGIYLLDEMDAADANVLLVLNAALANGDFFVEARMVSGLDPRVVRHADFGAIGAMNTFGTGGGSKFTGRNVLDAATLDRWFFVEMGYDESYESRLCGIDKAPVSWTPSKTLGATEAPLWLTWHQAMRAHLIAKASKREWSTRVLQKALPARAAGLSKAEVLEGLFAGWKPDEMTALGNLAHGPQGVK